MKKVKWIVSFLCSALIITIVSIMLFYVSKPNAVDASGSYTITVEKTTAGTIYVTGEGVTLKSQTSTTDIYEVEENTEATFTVVNENKIFTKWNITNDLSNTIISDTNKKVTTSIGSNMRIQAVYRDSVSADYGKLMGNRIVISNAAELIAIQNILNYGNTTPTEAIIKEYDLLFNSNIFYSAADDKATYITNNNLFQLVQSGYYLVEHNIVLFGTEFTGIGTKTYPFDGVMCGYNNNQVSQIVTLINSVEENNDQAFGLFGYLGENAVIRNLKVNSSIAITKSSATSSYGSKYVGGLAGYVDGTLLYNLNVSSSVTVNSLNGVIYAGNVIGSLNNVGLSELNKISTDLSKSSMVIASKGNIRAGMISGSANNTYFRNLDLDISAYNMSARLNAASYNASYTNYVGLITGEIATDTTIENIAFRASSSYNINGYINSGNLAIGGLVGYVDAETAIVKIGQIKFINSSEDTSLIKGISINASSQANIYTGGLIGLIKGENTLAMSSFKEGVIEVDVEGKIEYQYDPIFNGNFEIISVQNGLANKDMTYGKALTSGIIAKGYFDINGSSNKKSGIVVIKDGKLLIQTIQSSIASHESFTNGTSQKSDIDSDIEHAVSALFTGIVDNQNITKTFSNINMYAENVTVQVIREMGSKAMGDISIGNFVAHSLGISYDNIDLYLNHSSIKCDSLSYAVKNTNENTNNSYVGGMFGCLGNTSVYSNVNISNCTLDGYDWGTGEKIGNTLGITSIQNTMAGGGDYKGENYLGGVIGQLYAVNAANVVYNGSLTDEDFIDMRAHEDPDSAFCGGLIGFVKGRNGGYSSQINVTGCKVLNAFVYGEETVTIVYGNPDMYVAGLVGASFVHDAGSLIVNYDDNHVENTKIIGIGYERTEVFVSGLIGAITWSATQNITNSSVYNCTISSSASYINSANKCGAYAAGILAHNTGTTCTISGNVVIDTIVSASAPLVSKACGIMINYSGGTLNSSLNFSNAKINAYKGSSAGEIYGIGDSFSYSGASYYEKNNANSSSNVTALDTVTAISVASTGTNVVTEIGATTSSNFHLELKDIKGNFEEGDNNSIIKYIGNANESHSAVVEVWVNGNSTPPAFDDTLTIDELHQNGWYRFGVVIINNNVLATDKTDYIKDANFSYLRNDGEYVYTGENFKNILYPYNELKNINYTEEFNNNLYSVQIKLFTGIAKLKFTFYVDKTDPNLFMEFFDENGTELQAPNDKLINLGKYELTKEIVDNRIKYEYIFIPNVELNADAKLAVKFLIGSSNMYDDINIELNLIHNDYKLVGVTTAEYTPPVNYHTEEASRYNDPIYYLTPSNITKFIPVYQMSNDPNNSYVVDEINSNRVNYSISSSNGGTLKSSGELITSDTTSTTTSYKVNLTDKLKGDVVSLTYYIVEKIDISYDLDGAEFEGLLAVSSSTSYRFQLSTMNGYGGRFKEFTIQHGSKIFDLLDDTALEYLNSLGIIIKDNLGNTITTSTDYKVEADLYEIFIPEAIIKNDTIITAAFPRIYQITFNMQASFIENYDDEQRLLVVEENTNFHDYFANYKSELDDWIAKTCIFGYVFSDFYLVDDANTVSSYGESFNSIYEMRDFTINSSITFFGRWSFLIELIEAPGTHIKSSFAESFMQDYSEETLVNRTIKIPINKNKGYVFTVTKDDNYLGESSVKAYTVVEEGNDKVINDIKIEKYFENMYLYFIPPEAIKGYLVIETSVSNSGFIVGENTATVSDEVIPEDGVFTYKYVVNHRNSGKVKSYIYNSGNNADLESNLKLNKDILIRFSKQTFDAKTKKTALEKASIPVGSTIEVYYQKIVNGALAKKTVANYHVNQDNTTSLLLSNFTLLDNDTIAAFPVETFYTFLGNAETISEVYYIVITPPNGLGTINGEIFNYYMEVGYYNPDEVDEYVRGIRNSIDFANKPLEDLDIDEELKYESSKNTEFFSITPSRKTTLIKNNDGSYTFKDYNKYEIMELVVKNGKVDEATKEIRMFDSDAQNTILLSNKLFFEINSLKLKIGYGKGHVKVYGSSDGVTYELVKTITLNTIEYQEYEILEFADSNYTYFKIDNESLTEIRISDIMVMSKTNGIVYEFNEFVTSDKGENLKLDLAEKITNDSRHEGCHFFIGIQFKENSEFVTDIQNVKLITNIGNTEITIDPTSSDVKGKNVVYFDLTEILLKLQLENSTLSQFTFTISLGTMQYEIHAVELLEVFNVNKPAMGEVRNIING